MIVDFKCNIGDILYIADLEYKKVLEFKVDNFKVFANDFTAHGYMDCPWADKKRPFRIPREFSLKNLNKRVIFTSKKEAKKWMNEKLALGA